MKWITREHPLIDRVACPWLIRRFIDKDAEFIFVPFDQVKSKAREIDAIPYDIPEVEYTHYGDECTFDYFVRRHGLTDPALKTMSVIVRGADTDRHDIAAQSSGLWAIASGLSFNTKDDHELVEKSMLVYDALYSWAAHLQHIKHTQNPIEHLLLDVYEKFLKQKNRTKKLPVWARELKEIIQDQLDTNLSLNLKEISQSLNVHPAYLSREFSKYFDNLSFGEYIRKLRIEKAIDYLDQSAYSLAEIAYLCGFSDQSHFTRIFKKHTGQNPSAFRKNLQKSKTDPKSK